MALPKSDVPLYTMKLPSTGEDVRFRPFCVKEEKLLLLALAGKDEKEIIDAIRQVINNCLVENKIDVESIPMFDLEYIFVQLRSKSIGNKINVYFKGNENSKCEDCKKVKAIEINIDEIKVESHPEHNKDIKIGKDLHVIMKYPQLEILPDIEKALQSNEIAALFEMVIACIDRFYDKTKSYDITNEKKEDVIALVESLTSQQFAKIQNFFTTMPRLRYTVKYECKTCGLKEDLLLEGLQSFFG